MGHPPVSSLILATLAILFGSGGANGLTNYLDREVDARMERTRHRALPSKRIFPAYKILPVAIGLQAIALAIAWVFHPLCFFFGLLGATAASTWRKRITCVFPQGVIASCAPEWPVEELAVLDRNILRLALWEFAIAGETPLKVAINEAVELAKRFSSDSAPRFINGVLGTLAQREGDIRRQFLPSGLG